MNSSQRRQRARAIEAKYGAQADLLIATAKFLGEYRVLPFGLSTAGKVELYLFDSKGHKRPNDYAHEELVKALHHEKTRR